MAAMAAAVLVSFGIGAAVAKPLPEPISVGDLPAPKVAGAGAVVVAAGGSGFLIRRVVFPAAQGASFRCPLVEEWRSRTGSAPRARSPEPVCQAGAVNLNTADAEFLNPRAGGRGVVFTLSVNGGTQTCEIDARRARMSCQ